MAQDYAFLPMIWVEIISSPLTWYLMSTYGIVL